MIRQFFLVAFYNILYLSITIIESTAPADERTGSSAGVSLMFFRNTKPSHTKTCAKSISRTGKDRQTYRQNQQHRPMNALVRRPMQIFSVLSENPKPSCSKTPFSQQYRAQAGTFKLISRINAPVDEHIDSLAGISF